MALFAADKDKCTRCYACVECCPRAVIMPDADGYPAVTDEEAPFCMRCTHCVVHCAFGAVTLDGFGYDQARDIDTAPFPSPESSRRLLVSRRSVRKFTRKPLDTGTVKKLMDIARYAPTASNLQSVRWIFVEDPDTMEQLKLLYRSHIESERTDDWRYQRQREQYGRALDPAFRFAPNLAVALVPMDHAWKEDAAIALTYLDLAAHSMGVGACWSAFITAFLRCDMSARELMGVADGEWVGGALLLGYSGIGKPVRLPRKKEADLTVK